MAKLSPSVKLTVVIDNTSNREDAPSEHGLSLHLQSQNQCMLFDAGKSDLVISNLEALRLLDPPPEWIVFSHGHYDHTNGAPALLKRFPNLKPYFHPALSDAKWVLDAPNEWRYGGVPKDFPTVMPTIYSPPQELIPNIFSSGSLIDESLKKEGPCRFFKKNGDVYFKDNFVDEQILIVSTERGISVISGCAHTGIERAISKARELFPTKPFYALVGGFHLAAEPPEKLKVVLEKIISAGFKKVMPMHCSGENFMEMLAKEYPDFFVFSEVGATLDL